jgi:hypothetical protein
MRKDKWIASGGTRVGVDVSRTRINTGVMRNFRLGMLPTQECVITLYPW